MFVTISLWTEIQFDRMRMRVPRVCIARGRRSVYECVREKEQFSKNFVSDVYARHNIFPITFL